MKIDDQLVWWKIFTCNNHIKKLISKEIVIAPEKQLHNNKELYNNNNECNYNNEVRKLQINRNDSCSKPIDFDLRKRKRKRKEERGREITLRPFWIPPFIYLSSASPFIRELLQWENLLTSKGIRERGKGIFTTSDSGHKRLALARRKSILLFFFEG